MAARTSGLVYIMCFLRARPTKFRHIEKEDLQCTGGPTHYADAELPPFAITAHIIQPLKSYLINSRKRKG